MKTSVRRLQQLEQRHSESFAANDASGAREGILEKLNSTAARLRADPNWRPPTPEQAEEIKQYFKTYFAARARGTS